MNNTPWEPWEDAVIERVYPVDGWRGVALVLTHRTKSAIASRASKAGIQGQPKFSRPRKSLRPPGFNSVPWPQADVDACRLLASWRGPVSPNLGLRP